MSISVTLTSIYTRESMGGMYGRRSSLHLREKVALWLEKGVHASECFGGKTGQSCAVDVNGYVSLLITLE